jgi:Uma2 family endonuclease
MTTLFELDNDVQSRLSQITVSQLQSMIRAGILQEGAPVELIDGLLFWKDRQDKTGDLTTVGPRHAEVLGLLGDLLYDATRKLPVHVRNQLPVRLNNVEQPEPDLAIVAGSRRDYADEHPGPDSLLIVIEVADSSLAWDRTCKLPMYARTGIPCYGIVNLDEDCVEIYQIPHPSVRDYGQKTVFHPGETILFDVVGCSIPLAIDDFLTVARP